MVMSLIPNVSIRLKAPCAQLIFYHVILFNRLLLYYSDKCLLGDLPLTFIFLQNPPKELISQGLKLEG